MRKECTQTTRIRGAPGKVIIVMQQKAMVDAVADALNEIAGTGGRRGFVSTQDVVRAARKVVETLEDRSE